MNASHDIKLTGKSKNDWSMHSSMLLVTFQEMTDINHDSQSIPLSIGQRFCIRGVKYFLLRAMVIHRPRVREEANRSDFCSRVYNEIYFHGIPLFAARSFFVRNENECFQRALRASTVTFDIPYVPLCRHTFSFPAREGFPATRGTGRQFRGARHKTRRLPFRFPPFWLETF